MTNSQQLAHGLHPGTVLGNRYELLQFLGRGGFGRVFRARDRLLEIDCALKFLDPHLAEDQEQAARFKREILLGRKVRHENACQIFDFGEIEGYTLISMEFVDGWSLRERLESEPAPGLEELLKIVSQVCDALDVAHRQGIIHRDLKLENLMLDRTGNVKVMDFGIAHSAETANMTSSNKLMGTPLYMAPERWRGDTPEAPSDIYALGVLMYQLFTGRPPFESADFLVVCYNHVNDPPPPVLTLNPALPPALAAIMERCLEKDPGLRYQDAAELGRAIATVLTDGYEAVLPADLGAAPTAGGEAEGEADTVPVRRSYLVPSLLGGMAVLFLVTLGLLAMVLLTPEPMPEVRRDPTPTAASTPAPTPPPADPRLAEARAAAQSLYDRQVFITGGGDLDALRAYQRVLQLQPFDQEALERIQGIAAHYRKLAETALDLGHYDQALENYAHAMKADPGALDLRQKFEAAMGQRRLAAEMEARQEAEAKAKLEAEAIARREADERAKREAEERARREAEEQAKLEAAEKAKRAAEEKAKLEAEAPASSTPEPEGWTPASARDRQRLDEMLQEVDLYVERKDFGKALGVLKRAEERFGLDPELKVRISMRRKEVVELAQASTAAVPPTPEVPVSTAVPSPGSTGTIQFLVRPGAQVRVDGLLVGSIPIPPQKLEPGPHEIVLENAELGARLVKLVTVRAGQTLLIDEDLRFGGLDVETVPAARVAWRELPDGPFRELGMTPAKAQVPAGRDLELRLEAGGQTYRFQLRVPGGGRFAFRKTLAVP